MNSPAMRLPCERESVSRSAFRVLLFKCKAFTRPSGERVTFLCLCRKTKAFTRPMGERVTFFACAKKVTKESTPPVERLAGILPFRYASPLRGSLSAHPCAHNELARIVRATLRAILRGLAAPQGAPLGGILPAEERSRAEQDQELSRIKSKTGSRAKQDQEQNRIKSRQSLRSSLTQCRDARIRGSKGRRPRCRASQPGRDKPAGARRWIAALAKQCRDALSEQPRLGEKHRAFAAQERRKHCVRHQAFWLLLGDCQK